MKIKAAVLILALLSMLVMASGNGRSPAVAQMGHTVYTPLVQRDSCPACAPRPTPTPRMWHIWSEQE